MTLAIALRAFPYSNDGLRLRTIAAGEEFDCRSDLFPGLSRAGYVRAAHEDKMLRGAPETGVAMAFEPDALTITGKKPYLGEDLHVVIHKTITPEGSRVEIPADWRSLSWPQRRSLASKLTDEPITNGETADRVILAELANRG